MTLRHWTGRHLSHPVWHWVWLDFGGSHKHGYGPTYDIALATAHAAVAHSNGVVDPLPGFRRRF